SGEPAEHRCEDFSSNALRSPLGQNSPGGRSLYLLPGIRIRRPPRLGFANRKICSAKAANARRMPSPIALKRRTAHALCECILRGARCERFHAVRQAHAKGGWVF